MRKLVPADANLIPDTAERVFSGQIFDVYQWPQLAFNGETWTFEMLRRPDTVQTICIVQEQIVLLHDEQPYVGARLSLPGGRIDTSDISTEMAAKREVLEETGYTFRSWRLVSVTQPILKMEWFVHTFVAWDAAGSKVDRALDGGEIIEDRLIDLPTFRSLVVDAEGQALLPNGHRLLKNINTVADFTRLAAYSGKSVDR